MSHKLCNRCQFIVSRKNKLCTTCGSSSFTAIDDGKVAMLPGADSAQGFDAPFEQSFEPPVATLPPIVGISPKDRRVRTAAPHTLRHKFHEMETTRTANPFTWNSRR